MSDKIPEQPPDNIPPDDTVPEAELFLILGLTVVLMIGLSYFIFDYAGKASYIVAEAMIILPAMVYLTVTKRDILSGLRFYPVSWKTAFLSVVIGITVVVLCDEIQRLMEMVFPLPPEIESEISKHMTISGWQDLLLIGLGVVFVTGFAEEALFRGFLQKNLEMKRGVTTAITTTCLAFAVIHLNPWWVVQIVILAFVLGILAWRADSIIPGIIVHIVNNGTGLWSANADVYVIPVYNWKGHVNPIALVIAAVLLYFSMRAFFRETEYLHVEEENSPDAVTPENSSNWTA